MVDGQPHILVVDDEPIVGKRLKQALEPHGYDVDTVISGHDAVDAIEKTRYDVVVTDIRMDDIDGIEVLSRTHAVSPTTQVIIITGYATIELAREALVRGAFDFIAKPFKPSALLDVIQRSLSSRETQV